MGNNPRNGGGRIPVAGVFSLILILVFVSFILPVAGDKPPATGSLQVNSIPQGAEVYLNDVPSGQTPVVIPGLAEDVYNIRISLAGYEDYIGLVNVRGGTMYNLLTITLTPVPMTTVPTTSPTTTATTVPTTTVTTTVPTTSPTTTATTVPTTTVTTTVPTTSPTTTATTVPTTTVTTTVPTTSPTTTATTVPTTTVTTTVPTTSPTTTTTTVPTTTVTTTVPTTSPTTTGTTTPTTMVTTVPGYTKPPTSSAGTLAKPPTIVLDNPQIQGLSITVSGRTDPGTAGEQIDRVRWDWGDGNVEDHSFPASHTYHEKGSYQLTVSSHQSDGLSSMVHKTITVTDTASEIPGGSGNGSENDPNSTPPSTGPSLSLYNAEINPMSVTINGAVVPGEKDLAITRILWDWGDGNQTEYLGFPNSHGYAVAGMYTVRVTAYQDNGQSVTRSLTVQVDEPPVSPVATIPGGKNGSGIPPFLYAFIIGIGALGGVLYWKRELWWDRVWPGPESLERAVEQYHQAKDRWDIEGAKESAKECARLLRQLSDTDPSRRETYLEKAGIWDAIVRTIEEQKEQVFLSNDIEQIESSEHVEHLLADEEFGTLLSGTDVTPEVLTAVLRVAAEISREGREGKRVGTAFIVGDHEQVFRHSKQIVLNPFKGHAIEDREITDPGQWENIKEFAQLDGAFVVSSEGVVEAAGRYVTADTSLVSLPKGMGSRHVSIAGITMVTNSIGVVVSQSGGLIKIFRGGNIMRTIIP